MSFGKQLQSLRETAGLSQSELAQRSHSSIDTLRNWEQDRSLPKIDAVTRLARALGVSLDKLAYDPESGELTNEQTAALTPRRESPRAEKGAGRGKTGSNK